MTNAILSQQGTSLLQNLRHLFAGNHVRPDEIVATTEVTERYLVTAFVVWRFEHEITTTTTKGNAAVSGRHFGYRTADYQGHLRQLCTQAERDRDIRGPFMQHVDVARSEALKWSSARQIVHDFGSYSVFRQCGSCSGSGKVSCGGCGGRGRRNCSGCGGVGSHNQTVTRTSREH